MSKRQESITISEAVLAKCDAPNQFDNFDALVGRVLAVPRTKIVTLERQYKKESESNPNKRGPKPKRNS